MQTVQQSYIQDSTKFKRLVWDYTLTPEDFFEILEAKREGSWLTQDWAVARVLEHAPYYDAIALVPLEKLRERWQYVQPKIFNPEIRKGYDYVLRRHTLSAAR